MHQNAKVLIASALLWATGSNLTRSFAQDTEPVFIYFEFGDPSIAGLFPASRPNAEFQLSRELASRCFTNMPYWSFQPGNESSFPQLHMFLEKSVDLRLILELRPS